jgi:hypothetical protein
LKILLGLLLLSLLLPAWPAECHVIALRGISFSDELGGFVLERVTGKGSIADPFVVVERITDGNGATLTFRANPALGNLIGSVDTIGFALVKVIKNATGHNWSSLEIELQSKLGIPSDDTDNLSFGQGSEVGRPFTASAFAQVTLIDTPFDRIECSGGNVPPGGQVTLRFVITQPGNMGEAFIAQRPGRPVAQRVPNSPRLVLAGVIAGGREMRLVSPPVANRVLVGFPADLVEARRLHLALRFVE